MSTTLTLHSNRRPRRKGLRLTILDLGRRLCRALQQGWRRYGAWCEAALEAENPMRL